MKRNRKFILIIIILIISIYIFDKFSMRFPKYVLFRNGIKQSQIELRIQKVNFNFYLYHKIIDGEENIGLITLFKSNSSSKNWHIYNDSINNREPFKKNDVILLAHYGSVRDGKPIGLSVIGGYAVNTKNNGVKKVKILTPNNSSVEPILKKSDENGLYFISNIDVFINDVNDVKIIKRN